MATNDNSLLQESDADRRRKMIADTALSLDIVSALAGDRSMTKEESNRLADIKKSRGSEFFSDIFYSITHQYFYPVVAQQLWTDVLKHKYELSKAVGRNVKIAVAALDYLSNVTDDMGSATLIGEAHVREIVGLSLRDGLTGLFNHTYFYQQIEFEVKRFTRYGTPVSLVLIDIDDFKTVNDIYGHREGDRILSVMGHTLTHLARATDVCCRYGGEEFAVILSLTDCCKAEIIATRIREALSEKLADGRMITVSIGLASCGKNTHTYQTLVENADAALYQAKKSGKNRVVVAPDESLTANAGRVKEKTLEEAEIT